MKVNVPDTILERLFDNAVKGETMVHLTYRAGRAASQVAVEEAEQASDWNKPSDHYTGHFESIRRTKKGELLITLFVHNRGENGKFRAFNPSLGTISDIRIVP